MGLVTLIDGIPTFTTQAEALAWGSQHGGIQGFHTHIVDEQVTYMAGINHNAITSVYTPIQNIALSQATPEQLLAVEPMVMPTNTQLVTITQPVVQQVAQPIMQPVQHPVQQPVQQTMQQPVQPTPMPTPVVTTGSSGGGGGGGGGY